MSDNEVRYSGSDDDSVKPGLLAKKKKKAEKPGYKMFDADESDEEAVLYDDSTKTPTAKLKKHSRPSFKFNVKNKLKEKEKEDKRESVDKKEDKEARRVQSKKVKDAKEPKPRKKKDKSQHGFGKKNILGGPRATSEVTSPVFGVPLATAVERTPSYDGVQLPVVVRECIDYVEEHGLLYEGIYRISGVKSKVQMLREAYNRRSPAYLYEHDPSIVASLLKQFIRELPETILTSQMAHKFEEASVANTEWQKKERLRMCIDNLPPCNKELLSWMIVHMSHVIAKEQTNKMNLQNVSIVLSPTMRISHRVLNVLFMYANELFADVKITRYRPPLEHAVSKWSVDIPDDASLVQGELVKQEAELNRLHSELQNEKQSHARSAEKEELIWEVQRHVTQLKRKLKLIAKTTAARELEKQQLSADNVKRADPNRRSINAVELNFALQTGSLRRNHRSSQVELASTPASVSASNEALAGQQRHVEAGARGSRLSQTTSISSDTNKPVTQQDTTEQEVPAKPDIDLELPLATEDVVTEMSMDSSLTPVSPESKPLQSQTSVETEKAASNAVTPDEPLQSVELNMADLSLQPTDAAAKVETEPVGGMTASTSQDSDVTLSPYTSAGVSESLSQHSLSDHKHLISEVSAGKASAASKESIADREAVARKDSSELSTSSSSQVKEETTSAAYEVLEVTDHLDLPANQSNAGYTPLVQSQSVEMLSAEKPTEQPTSSTAMLLIPEKLHAGAAHDEGGTLADSNDVYNIADDDELRLLIAEEAQLIWEEEELIAIKDELRQKIDTEVIEIDRLHEEIAEYEELRSITTLGHSSEAMSSDDEYYTSTSDTDPEDEDVAQAELDSLVMELHELTERNMALETENAETVKKIHEERMGCVNVKIQIRLLQQQKLGSQAEEQSLI